VLERRRRWTVTVMGGRAAWLFVLAGRGGRHKGEAGGAWGGWSISDDPGWVIQSLDCRETAGEEVERLARPDPAGAPAGDGEVRLCFCDPAFS